MPHVVTDNCQLCRFTDCVEVCPVDCFWEIENPRMLVIDPDTCIDCQLCVPECPINAIYEESETPEPNQEWIAKNRDLFAQGHVIATKKDPLPEAKSLEQLQEDEKQRGWSVQEPRNA